MKANPSLSGVVIDKKMFSRAVKTRESKKQDKVLLAKIDEEYEAKNNDLKDILVEKLLILTEDKVSQGVKDYSGAEIITKGSKFTAPILKNLEYDGIQSNGWTDDAHTNELIQKLIKDQNKKAPAAKSRNCRTSSAASRPTNRSPARRRAAVNCWTSSPSRNCPPPPAAIPGSIQSQPRAG